MPVLGATDVGMLMLGIAIGLVMGVLLERYVLRPLAHDLYERRRRGWWR